jgi:hypothetical protein
VSDQLVVAKAPSAEPMTARNMVGVVTWVVQVTPVGPGMSRTVAAASELLAKTGQVKQEKLTLNPKELPPARSPSWSSGSSVSSKSTADSYNSWSESELLNTGESAA